MKTRWLAAVVGAVAAVAGLGIAVAPAAEGPVAVAAATGGGAAEGRALYTAGCASCHALSGRGVRGRGPSLVNVGEAALDFYLSTGRMPLARPGIQPDRADPVYDPGEIRAITRYALTFGGGGPAIPVVRPENGDTVEGRQLFTDNCSGCHQIQAKGGIAPGFVAPPLDRASSTQIGEAIRVGPYLMPRFGERQLTRHDVDSIARYLQGAGTHPVDAGGWGIGNIGPVTEGLVALLLLGGLLVLTARAIGERAPS